MIYIDTSAMTKLLIAEAESSALIAWISDHRDSQFVSSALGRIELMRAVLRHGTPGLTEKATRLLDGVDTIPMTATVVSLAETIGPPSLRSLDAIHLASAAQIRPELVTVLAYDARLLSACHAEGFPTATPT